jgi:predicted esterase
MKKIIIIILFCLLNTNLLADKKFEKDLKKISKDNAFIDNTGKIYSLDKVDNKENTILVIYTHGSMGDQKLDKCLSKWNLVPQVIRNLHNKKINNYEVKIYRLCSGVRGWSKSEQDKMWKHHEKTGKLSLKDSKGEFLITKQKQNQKLKVIENTIDKFADSGFKNIILAGHSSGGWQSLKIQSNNDNLIDGVIGLHPGAGGTVKNRKEWPWWEDIRYYGFGDFTKLNAIIITHDKDNYNSPNDYSLLKKSNDVEFVNISDSKCKKKATLGGYHGLALTKCYADEEKKEKDLVNYLGKLF